VVGLDNFNDYYPRVRSSRIGMRCSARITFQRGGRGFVRLRRKDDAVVSQATV
jgi:hypothetical protein